MKIKSKTGQGIVEFLTNEFVNQPAKQSQCFGTIAYANTRHVSRGNYITTQTFDKPDARINRDSFFYVNGHHAKNFIRKHPELFNIVSDKLGSLRISCTNLFLDIIFGVSESSPKALIPSFA